MINLRARKKKAIVKTIDDIWINKAIEFKEFECIGGYTCNTCKYNIKTKLQRICLIRDISYFINNISTSIYTCKTDEDLKEIPNIELAKLIREYMIKYSSPIKW